MSLCTHIFVRRREGGPFPVSFSTLHTCLNYRSPGERRLRWRSAGAYRLRFDQCRSLIGMPWQLDFTFDSADPAKMVPGPKPHKIHLLFSFASIKICGSRSQNLPSKMLSRRVKLLLTGYQKKDLLGLCVCVCTGACTCVFLCDGVQPCLFTRSLSVYVGVRPPGSVCRCAQRGGSACVCLNQARSAMWDNLAGTLHSHHPPPSCFGLPQA